MLPYLNLAFLAFFQCQTRREMREWNHTLIGQMLSLQLLFFLSPFAGAHHNQQPFRRHSGLAGRTVTLLNPTPLHGRGGGGGGNESLSNHPINYPFARSSSPSPSLPPSRLVYIGRPGMRERGRERYTEQIIPAAAARWAFTLVRCFHMRRPLQLLWFY